MNDLNGIMRKVAALIARADHAGTPPAEAESCRAKAEKLIREYQLEEEQLIQADGTITPVWREVELTKWSGEFRHQYCWLWDAIARHCGIEFEYAYRNGSYYANACGYDVDLRLAELLFSSARLVFGAHLEPDVDSSLSEAENVYRLRSAGMERNRIAAKMWGASLGDAGHAAHAKVGRLYREECARRGEDAAVSGRTVSAKDYRTAYARSFVDAVERRLRIARDAADAAAGALVSVGRRERVQEAFWTQYPDRRPQPAEETTSVDVEAASGAKKKSRSPSKATLRRWQREYYSPTALAAAEAAERAAEGVLLDRRPSTDRVESAPETPRQALQS